MLCIISTIVTSVTTDIIIIVKSSLPKSHSSLFLIALQIITRITVIANVDVIDIRINIINIIIATLVLT